ncbi:MAG: hypothetical protein AB7O73_02605 [Bacteroidia bacterium]
MIRIFLFISISVLVLFSSCKSKSKNTESKHVKAENSSGSIAIENNGAEYIIISFQSKGGGIDQETKGELDKYLSSFEKKYIISLLVTKKNWGREGEVNYCIEDSNLTDITYKELLSGIKKIVSNKELITIKEAKSCD